MSTKMRFLLDHIETNNVYNILSDPRERQAANLRMQFFKKNIIQKTERDYAYTALREYRYGVQQSSFFVTVGVAASLGMFNKFRFKLFKICMFTLPPTYYLAHKYYFVKLNKRLFDMCNLGEDTELGYLRNQVLREANKILNREDF